MRMYGGGLDRLAGRCVEDINQLLGRISDKPDMTFDPWDLIYDAACNIMLNMVGEECLLQMANTHDALLLKHLRTA